MRYKVPQSIDMQDRILGPLTMVQFIYAVIGGGFCYGIFMSLPHPLSYFIIVPVAMFVLALIFVKINERPFLDFFLSVIQFSSTPKQRLWHHENMSDMKIEVYKTNAGDKKPVVASKRLTKEDIGRMAKQFDEKKN